MDVTAIPLSLYVHWPWCLQKCPYCDFNSHALPKEDNPAERYIEALILDLEKSLPLTANRPLQSIFIGGGTPSLIAPNLLDRFLTRANDLFPFANDIEITLEANPGTVDVANFKAYRQSGVNRLSMGIQSFDDSLLKRLGRVHNRAEALKAIKITRETFENFNLDLMFALPGQTLSGLKFDLAEALSAESTHLSFYQLTIEPNTVFAKHTPNDLPDEDLCVLMQDTVIETLEAAGFEHYEVSGYARPGKHCRHNLNYWQFGDYIACGAGAHSKITLTNDTIVRERRFSNPESFISHALAGNAVAENRAVEKDEQAFEFMLNVLRLKEGVDSALLTQRTHLTMEDIQENLNRARGLGLMPEGASRIKATGKGWAFLSDLQEMFL